MGSGLILAGIGKGISDASATYGNAMFKMAEAEYADQRALQRQEALDEIKRQRVIRDSAAAETCPYWPGSPVKVHWGYPDPSLAAGDEDAKRRAFELTRQALGYRFLQLLALPLERLSPAALAAAATAINHS